MTNSLDPRDLDTETFSNGRGWRAVRVTHRPSALVVERARTQDLRSAVQAQRECIDELRRLVARHAPQDAAADTVADAAAVEAEPPSSKRPSKAAAAVSRAEFDRLVARVNELEARLAALGAAGPT